MASLWFTGPPEDRFRYRVADPSPLPGGQGFVFAASMADDVSVALKLRDDAPIEIETQLRARLAAVGACQPPAVAAPLEVFRGPGLFQGSVPPPTEDSDLLYVAMRWVPGRSLRAEAPLNPVACAAMARSLAAGLAHLHERCGFVHRDVHPGNIILDQSGHASLIDLGAVRPDDGTATVTVAGAVGFIAPERAYGPGDARTDAWGLGMVTAFALLGHPLAARTASDLASELAQRLGDRDAARRVARLLDSLTALDPAARPTDLVGWADELTTALTDRRRRAKAVVAAIGVTFATGVLVAGALNLRGGEGSDAHATTTSQPSVTTGHSATVATAAEAPECTTEVGATDDTLRPDQLALVEASIPALEQMAPGGCGIGEAGVFGEAAFQGLRWEQGGEEKSGIVLVSPASTLVLTPAQWASYREIAGRTQPDNAIRFGGYPVGLREPPAPGGTAIALSMGGLLIGARADTQAFWMPRPVLALWESQGGATGDLGLPMTNPYIAADGLRQDFAGGYLRLPPEVNVPLASVSPEDLELHLEPDPQSLLPGPDLREGIVRQPSASAWWIDAKGVRHWIFDGATYMCLGGDAAVKADNLAGAALATFELGPPAACENT